MERKCIRKAQQFDMKVDNVGNEAGMAVATK